MTWKLRIWLNWPFCTGLWGTTIYTLLYLVVPAPMRTREVIVALLVFACTMSSVAAGCRPQPEQWLK